MTPAINYNAHGHKSCSNTRHNLTIHRLHYKNTYSDEEEPKKRERKWERNEARGRKKKVKKIKKLNKIIVEF